MSKYSVRIIKNNSVKAYIQVTGERLCHAMDSFRNLGYTIATIKKLKQVGN